MCLYTIETLNANTAKKKNKKKTEEMLTLKCVYNSSIIVINQTNSEELFSKGKSKTHPAKPLSSKDLSFFKSIIQTPTLITLFVVRHCKCLFIELTCLMIFSIAI